MYTSCLTIPHPPREATATLPEYYGAMGVPFDALYEHSNDYDYDYDYEYDYGHASRNARIIINTKTHTNTI